MIGSAWDFGIRIRESTDQHGRRVMIRVMIGGEKDEEKSKA